MPDFFRGKALTEADLGDRAAIHEWLGRVGTYQVVSMALFYLFELANLA
jgi:hypothetical protein